MKPKSKPVDTRKLAEEMDSFLSQRGYLHNTDTCHGECDAVSMAFLEQIEKAGIVGGYLLHCGTIKKMPSQGISMWGKPVLVSHYVVCLGEQIIDWTARQFWTDADVPLIIPKANFGEWWDDIVWDYDARIDLAADGLIDWTPAGGT